MQECLQQPGLGKALLPSDSRMGLLSNSNPKGWEARSKHGSFLQLNSASEIPGDEMPLCLFQLSKNCMCFEVACTTGTPTPQTHTFSNLINVRLKQTKPQEWVNENLFFAERCLCLQPGLAANCTSQSDPFLLVQGRVLRFILAEPEGAGLLRRKQVLCAPTMPETKANFFSWSAFSQQRWQLSFCCCFEPC